METACIRYLKQGELYFGDFDGTISTILGSCVAIVLWHPGRHLGGMCHIVLPDGHNTTMDCDERFADCAIENFIKHLQKYGTSPKEYWTGIYGGGNMFPSVKLENFEHVGSKNINSILARLEKHGFCISDRDIGGSVRRRLTLSIKTGEVHLVDTDM